MKKSSKNKKKLGTKTKLTPAILTAKPAKQDAALLHIEKRIAAGEKITRAELKIYYELEKITNPESIRGVKEAAAYCGMTERILRYDLGRQRLKANPDGTFDRAEIDRWVKSRDGREKSPEDASLTAKEKKAKAHYWTFKAKKEELLYNNSRDLLVAWPEVRAEWAGRIRELTSGLGAFADRLAGLIVGKDRDDVHEIIKSEVRTIMETYSRTGKHTPEVK
jgi:hypothetical protein